MSANPFNINIDPSREYTVTDILVRAKQVIELNPHLFDIKEVDIISANAKCWATMREVTYTIMGLFINAKKHQTQIEEAIQTMRQAIERDSKYFFHERYQYEDVMTFFDIAIHNSLHSK